MTERTVPADIYVVTVHNPRLGRVELDGAYSTPEEAEAAAQRINEANGTMQARAERLSYLDFSFLEQGGR